MSTIIEQAIKGKRKALKYLYNESKQKVYYVSQLLSNSEAEAAEVINYAYRTAIRSMSSHGITNEEEFTHFVIRKAVDYCKGKIGKRDPKVFRIPPHKNFLIAGSIEKLDSCESVTRSMLKAMPILQRYIFVLHNVAEYLPEQIASAFKFDMNTVGLALATEEPNVERVLRHLDREEFTYQSILERTKKNQKQTVVPAQVDEGIAQIIDNIARPAEEKARKRVIVISAIALAVCAITVGIVLLIGKSKGSGLDDLDYDVTDSLLSEEEEEGDTENSVIDSPVIELDETLTYYADIEIADYGTITVELDQASAPITVANFVNLAQNGFYDGLTFHRIIEDFMMQGGDPNGDGTGGSSTNIVGEFTDNGYENTLSHTRGAISMARSSEYDSASSQFFIVHEDSSASLDGQYAVFGYVSEGMDLVDAICESAEPTDDNGTIESDAQPMITAITIRTE